MLAPLWGHGPTKDPKLVASEPVESEGVGAEELGGDVVAQGGGQASDFLDGSGEIRVPVRVVRRVHEPVVTKLLDAGGEHGLLGFEAEEALPPLQQLPRVGSH